MNILRKSALLALAACQGLVLMGCQPSNTSAPTQPTLDSIAVTPGTANLAIGSTQALAVTGAFSNSSTLDLTCSSTFTSSATTIASVSATGVVTALKAGTATITATQSGAQSGGCSQIGSGKTATAAITVPAPPVVAIGVTPTAKTLAPGETLALSVVAISSDASTTVLTSGITFLSSDTAIATVSAAGLVTAQTAGAATITATQTASGKTATVSIEVVAPVAFTTITFDSPTINYTFVGFAGAENSSVQVDPTGGPNLVARVVRSATAETFAGTVVVTQPNNTVGELPFDAANTRMTVRVYSPAAGIPVRLKVEDSTDPAVPPIGVETQATTTVADAWETLTFDFANPVTGSGLNPAKTYDKVIIFFNFGATGAAAGVQTYYFDDVAFIGGTGGGGGGSPFSTITFDDSPPITYTFVGFNGAEDSSVQTDPTGGPNKVARVIRSATAATFAGTVVVTQANNTVGIIPFDVARKVMTVRVYSPAAGITVRLKVENATNPGISVDTEATTTVASAWETLTFNFANPVQPPSLNLAATYSKVIIFFNFGVAGATAGAQTYYFDDVTLLP